MIFHCGQLFGLYQLEAVFSGTVELYLHIALTDDLALECGREGYRDIDFRDLDLDITRFKRSSVEFVHVFLNDQALRYAEDILGLVGNNRETKCDRACAACYDYIIQRFECINECRHTLEGVLHQVCSITRCYVTEDQSCTKCNRYYMDDGCYILAKRYDTYCIAHVQACFHTLVNNAAYQSHQDTLCLIALHQSHCVFFGRSASEDNSHARDIAGNQRHAQLTDGCICQMSVKRLLIRSCTVDVFQYFDKLCTERCSHAAHKCIVQSLFSGHERFDNAKSSL